MRDAYPSRAGWRTIGAAAALTLAGCASATPPPSLIAPLIQASDPGNAERPAFFVQWTPGMPGLTQRPAIDESTKLPAYPAAAERNRAGGRATLESCLTVDGRLVDVHLVASTGSAVLDEATLEWAKTAKYLPAAFNGEPFAICGYRFDYEWRVEDDD